VVVTLYIGWIIWAAMIGGEGQTPGKKLLGMRVIGADTVRPVGLGRMFGREMHQYVCGHFARPPVTISVDPDSISAWPSYSDGGVDDRSDGVMMSRSTATMLDRDDAG
jgi:hypothetical protein